MSPRAILGALGFVAIATTTSAARATPFLGPALDLDPDPGTHAPRGGDDVEPCTAFDGTNYFVTWFDELGVVWGTRVAPDGTVLDDGGIYLYGFTHEETISEGFSVTDLSATFDGQHFVVAFEIYDNTKFEAHSLTAVRVGSDGTVLDPGGIVVNTSHLPPGVPNTAWLGLTSDGQGTSLVAWQDNLGQNIYAARIDPCGKVKDPDGILVCGDPDQGAQERGLVNAAYSPSSGFVVAWKDLRDGKNATYGARIAADGTVTDPNGKVLVADDTQNPRIVGGPNGLALAWFTASLMAPEGPGPQFVSRVDASLTLLDGMSGLTLPSGSDMRVVRIDAGYEVRWNDANGNEAVTLSDQGVLGTPGLDVDGASDFVSGPSGERFLVASYTLPSTSLTQLVGLQTADAQTPPPLANWTPLALSGESDLLGSVATDGQDVLAVWKREGGWVAGRFDASGTRLEPAPTPLTTPSTQIVHPAAAGTGKFLALDDDTATFLEAGGSALATTTVALPTGHTGLAASGQADEFVIITQDASGALYSIVATSSLGALAAPVLVKPSTDPLADGVAIATSGQGYLVAWDRVSAGVGVQGVRLTLAGAPLDTSSITLATSHVFVNRVTYGDSNYLVTYSGAGFNTGGVFVEQDGTVSAPLAFTKEIHAICFDGSRFMVAATDTIAGDPTESAFVFFLDSSAHPLTPALSAASPEIPVDAVCTPKHFIFQNALDPAPHVGAFRAQLRLVDPSGDPSQDGEGGAPPSQCAGGSGPGGGGAGGASNGSTGTTSGSNGSTGSTGSKGTSSNGAAGGSEAQGGGSSPASGGCGCHLGTSPEGGAASALLALGLLARRRRARRGAP